MKSLKNRIMSSAMAGVMALSLAVPAFAASNQTVITGTYVNTPIAVTVPNVGTAQINPYGLDVKLPDTTSKVSGNQIVTMPLAVINNSEMALSVGASVTATTTGGFTFGTASSNMATMKTKTGLVYFQMKADNTLDDDDTDSGVTDSVKLTDAALDPLFEEWGEFVKPAAGSKDLLLKTSGATVGTDLVVLDPINPDTSDTNNKHQKVGGVGLFRLAGEVVTSPTEAWTTDDGFSATVAFTFSPVKTYTVTQGTVTGTNCTITIDKPAAIAGATVTLTGIPNASETVSFTVKDAGGNTVATSPVTGDALSVTFTMPASNVTVDATFTTPTP